MDVVNVHDPSGKGNQRRLKDWQRRQLLTNLLQSSSQASATAGANIGYAHFLMGGDMNAKKADLTQALQTCRDNDARHTKEQMHERDGAKYGALCVSAGIQARTLKETASHFDPQHEPYGVCWFVPQGSATQQPLPGSLEEAPTCDDEPLPSLQ